MARIKCYSGDNPLTEDEGIAIWKWAKTNLIDQGMPLEKVAKEINDKFFFGQGKPEWAMDVLAGRKTPFRELSQELWKKQYYRRQIQQQAEGLSKFYGMHPALRAALTAWEVPRFISTISHGHVFPLTHAGDLLLRPLSWGEFGKGYMNAWKAMNPAESQKMVNAMEGGKWFDIGLEGKLDVAPNSRPDDIISRQLLTSKNPAMRGFLEQVKKYGVDPAERAWDALKVMRYELFAKKMEKYATPEMSHAQLLDLATHFADWANHATGSAKLRIPGMEQQIPPYLSSYFFGPKLTASKWARVFADPAKTLATVAKMAAGKKTSAGERAVAMTRISGATQWALTRLGFLSVNWGVNHMLGMSPQNNVNFTDPRKSDWLKFKTGGIAPGIALEPPGLSSEMRLLAKVFATQMTNDEDIKKTFRGATKGKIIGGALQSYIRGKAGPAPQIGWDIATGQTLPAYRPVPWSKEPGTAAKPRMTPLEYTLSKMPIPTTGPIAYVYDQMRRQGMDESTASKVIKGLTLFGFDFLGMHAYEQSEPEGGKQSGQQAMAPAPIVPSHHVGHRKAR